MALAYGIGGLVSVPAGPISGNGAPPASFKGQLGQQYFDNSTSPPTEYIYNGSSWLKGGNADATTTVAGIVKINTDGTLAGADDTTVPTSLATKTYADNLAIAGAPVSTETTAGIGQLATDAEAVAGTASTGLLALFVTPSNLAPVFAAAPAIGGTTPAAAVFTNLTASGTISLDTTAATHYKVTGAADMTLESTAGGVDLVSGLAAADAITLQAASGGIDIDGALLVSISSSRNNAQAIQINASAGGIDITATGAATEDIDIVNTGGSVNISATESAADSITIVSTAGGIDILASGAAAGEDIDIVATGSSVNITSTENNAGAVIVKADGGTSERVTLISAQGTGADSVNLESTAGGITLSAALATADAINLAASAGGVDIDGALQVNIASSQNAVDAIRIVASAGGIDIDAVGAATEDINITNTGGSIVLSATESAADAIKIEATAGGIDILASGAAAGEDIDIIATGSSINISATENNAGAITIGTNGGTSEAITVTAAQGTGASSVALTSTAGGITLTAGLATADAINLVTSAAGGGIDVDAGTAGFIVDTTGAISLDSAAASNFTVTGAFDLSVITTAGSLNLTAGEDAADAIVLSAGAGGIDILATGAAGQDIDIVNTGGSVNISATESAADSITIVSTAGGIDILASGAAAGEDIDIIATGSSVNISATESAADSITIISTAGGIDISASGAAAGEDIDITATGSSINITATENVSDAIVINASGAASGMTLDCGTACLTIGTGMKHAVTSVATAASPYTVLGTDYVISTDTTGGALTLTLPATPGTGRTLVIFDGVGQAAIGGAITIDGNGNNIAAGGTSAATKAINTAYESYTLYFNGTIWLGQNVV